MSIFFRSMVGAAMFVAAGASTASAQDYTWTLSNFTFGDYYLEQNLVTREGTEFGSGASGKLVLHKIGPGQYTLKSFNFTTTADIFGTGYANTYAYGSNPTYFSEPTQFQSSVTVMDSGGDFGFKLIWAADDLFDAMDSGYHLGWASSLQASATHSYEYDVTNTGFIRFSGASSNPNCNALQDCNGPWGTLTLTSIAVPEPASLVLLGTGLLGILATRRRKTA